MTNGVVRVGEVSWPVAIGRVFLSMFVLSASIVALDFMVYLGATSSTFNHRVAAAFSEGYDYGYAQTFDVAFEEAQVEGYDKGYIKGFEIVQGLESGKEVSRLVEMRNPTFGELIEFLAADKTDEKPFISGEYVCFDYTAELNNNADAAGIRAAYVRIRSDEWGHAVAAFETVDKGLVFIEPQSDSQVALVIGKPYPWWQVGATSPLGYSDNILEIQIIW
ncbi:MAG: hypothetical protein V3S02_03835 [Dehalococcoidales bacterium]